MVRPPIEAALVLTAITAVAAMSRVDEDDILVQTWIAAPPHGDYIERVELLPPDGKDGDLHLIRGYGQLVRCEYYGSWRRSGGDFLRLEYIDEYGEWQERVLDFSIDHGDFNVIDHDTGMTRHFGCRIAFDDSPFPPRCDTQRVYYGCPR